METTGGAPISQGTVPVETSGAEVMPENMTGEQAKAWVEAQKAKAKGPKKDPYLADNGKKVNYRGGQDGSSEPQDSSSAVKEAVAEAKRRLKIDDEEVDEDEVIKIYKQRRQHQQVASKTLNEGKAALQQAKEFVELLRTNPKAILENPKLGIDARKLAEEILVSHLSEEMLTPEQKEQRKRDKELEDYRTEKQKREQFEKEKLERTLRDKYAADYTQQFTKALSEINLPPTKHTVAAMARYIGDAAKINFEMTALEAARLVKEDLLEAQRRIIGETDGETLIKLLGEDVANKIRKWDTGRLRDPNPPRVSAEDQGKPREKRMPHKRMSAKEWREYNRR